MRSAERSFSVAAIAADVCKALDLTNLRTAVSRLDEDEKGVALTDTLGGKQKCLLSTNTDRGCNFAALIIYMPLVLKSTSQAIIINI